MASADLSPDIKSSRINPDTGPSRGGHAGAVATVGIHQPPDVRRVDLRRLPAPPIQSLALIVPEWPGPLPGAVPHVHHPLGVRRADVAIPAIRPRPSRCGPPVGARHIWTAGPGPGPGTGTPPPGIRRRAGPSAPGPVEAGDPSPDRVGIQPQVQGDGLARWPRPALWKMARLRGRIWLARFGGLLADGQGGGPIPGPIGPWDAGREDSVSGLVRGNLMSGDGTPQPRGFGRPIGVPTSRVVPPRRDCGVSSTPATRPIPSGEREAEFRVGWWYDPAPSSPEIGAPTHEPDSPPREAHASGPE